MLLLGCWPPCPPSPSTSVMNADVDIQCRARSCTWGLQPTQAKQNACAELTETPATGLVEHHFNTASTVQHNRWLGPSPASRPGRPASRPYGLSPRRTSASVGSRPREVRTCHGWSSSRSLIACSGTCARCSRRPAEDGARRDYMSDMWMDNCHRQRTYRWWSPWCCTSPAYGTASGLRNYPEPIQVNVTRRP